MKRINEESVLMIIPNEVKGMVKEEAIKINRTGIIILISLLLFSFVTYTTCFILKADFPLFGLGILILFSFFSYFRIRIPLGEASLNKWYWSLPNSSLVVKNVDSLVKEKEKKEKEVLPLNEYKIKDKSGKRHLLLVKDGKEMSFPLNEVEYDEGEKRIEFHVSDRDWTVNIQKGTWFNVKIYNV